MIPKVSTAFRVLPSGAQDHAAEGLAAVQHVDVAAIKIG